MHFKQKTQSNCVPIATIDEYGYCPLIVNHAGRSQRRKCEGYDDLPRLIRHGRLTLMDSRLKPTLYLICGLTDCAWTS